MGNDANGTEAAAKQLSTKQRLLYLYKHLVKHSDAAHPISTRQLMDMLEEQYEIHTNRNTVSNDLHTLVDCGMQISYYESTQNRYYYEGQIYEPYEIKLLVDAVSSSKFITQEKSLELIEKLLKLTNTPTAEFLQRHIYAADRVKTDNEKGYYIVDALNEAIAQKLKVQFYYTDFDLTKQRYITNDGNPYTLSPYELIWDGDYYYVRGFCDEREQMRNFRLDRIDGAPVLLEETAELPPEDYNPAAYSRSVFRMYDTDEPTEVTLLCEAGAMKYLIDNFGMDFPAEPVDEDSSPVRPIDGECACTEPTKETMEDECFSAKPTELEYSPVKPESRYFRAKVSVCTSPTFYRWIFGFGGKIRIEGPGEVAEGYRKMLMRELSFCEAYPGKSETAGEIEEESRIMLEREASFCKSNIEESENPMQKEES